jgi:hypothetical protein
MSDPTPRPNLPAFIPNDRLKQTGDAPSYAAIVDVRQSNSNADAFGCAQGFGDHIHAGFAPALTGSC